ncbi:glutathione S-transferase family protein [Pseudooceanicola sp. LIPI14-2-Ac024]|uniref:glutathione S-transferase family protein n=1 Tax=Pseudooceanicola sp. LIPI14-2-Ac024 TaxID=3344875 RepID=UPI0035D0FDB6
MLTFFHAPRSRSTRILALLKELGALDKVERRIVTIPRQDGSGGPDAANPHPEGKVPLLVHNGEVIRETTAIALYLTDLFPAAGLGPKVGETGRGSYLSWLAWYGDVMEPVYVFHAAGLAHPLLDITFRGVAEVEAQLTTALSDGRDYLLGARFSAADMIVASPYGYFPDAVPADPKVRAWVDRCLARPSLAWAAAEDDAAMAA